MPDAALAGLTRGLRADLANSFVRVRPYTATEDDMGEDFARAENYLSLVGLVIVILGGVGVSSVTRVFVQQKLKQHRRAQVPRRPRRRRCWRSTSRRCWRWACSGGVVGVGDRRRRDGADAALAQSGGDPGRGHRLQR